MKPHEAGHHLRVGNIGLYYVCYRLSMKGWNVMPTARNARGVDILAYSPDASRKRLIQVKTLSKKNPVPLGEDTRNLIADYFVICRNADSPSSSPECFVMALSDVKRLAQRREKDGKASYWLEQKDYVHDEYREAWDLLGQPQVIAAEPQSHE